MRRIDVQLKSRIPAEHQSNKSPGQGNTSATNFKLTIGEQVAQNLQLC